jgi:hypothetical protein
LFFDDVGRNPIMEDDPTMSSNLLIVPKWYVELEETPFDLNVSQWPCKEKLIKKVVHTKMVHSVWDCQVLFNLCALAIYLELVITFGNKIGRFDEC